MFEISENTIARKGMLFLYSGFHLIHKVDNFTLLKFQHNLYTFKSYELKLYVQWQIEIYIKIDLRACSHLTTATQIFDVVSMSSEMGCIVTNVTVRT